MTILAALLLAGCGGTTSFNTTWKSADSTSLQLQRGDPVVAMVVTPNEAMRRGAEHELVKELQERGLNGIPSYTIIPNADVMNREEAKARIDGSGAKAALVMRITDKETEVSSSMAPMYGPYYGGFWGGYYGAGWGAVYDPGYLTTDTYVTVETLVYDLKTDKLVWAGESETMNPDKASDMFEEVIEKAAKKMRKEGVLLAAPKA